MYPIHTLKVGGSDPRGQAAAGKLLGSRESVGPRSVYDETKRRAEAMTVTYHRTMECGSETGPLPPKLHDLAIRGEPISLYGDGSETGNFC